LSDEVNKPSSPAEKINPELLVASTQAAEVNDHITRTDCLSESPTRCLSPLASQFNTAPLQLIDVRGYLN
jgi:hypothetical protein